MRQRLLLKSLFLLCALIGGVLGAWATDVTYKLTIDASDFNTTSYAENNTEKTSYAVCTTDNTKTYEVKWTSNQVMKSGNNMQWQKSNGYIYNSTALGTITNVTVTSSAGTFTTYYGTSAQPSSGTTVGGGYFKTKVGGATGTTSKIEVTFTISESGDNTPTPTHTATFSVNGATTTQDVEEGAAITFPADPTPIYGKVFMGWVTETINGTTNEAPTSFVTSATMGNSDVIYYAVFADKEGTSEEVTKTYGFESETDNDWTIDGPVRTEGNANTGSYSGKISTNNTYVTFNSKVKVKEFSFAFKRTSTNSNHSVYIETSSDNSTWNAADTYPMGDFANGSYTTKSKVFDGNSELYVRFHCYNTTAVRYLDDITIKYTTGTVTYSNYCTTVVAPSVARPEITIAQNPFLFSTTATITCTTQGAAIKYSFDNETWNNYSGALTINATTTIYAKAVLGNDESSVASVIAKKNLADPTVTVSGDLILDLNGETNVSAGTLTYTVTYNDAAVEGAAVTWLSSAPEVATIGETTGVVTLLTTGEVTFTATFSATSDYAEATGTKTITVVNSKQPGTVARPYTVAEARAAIDAGTGTTGVYATGVVSGIVEAYSTQYGNISYNISVDGETTNDQLQAFRGKSYGGESFTSADDIQVGDVVVIYGNLKKYNSTYEFDKDNQLVSLQRPETPAAPTFSLEEGTYTSAQSVEISCTTDGATIYYSINNSEASEYTGPITLDPGLYYKGTYTFKAYAKKGFRSSEEVSATYTINREKQIVVAPSTIDLGIEGGSDELAVTYINFPDYQSHTAGFHYWKYNGTNAWKNLDDNIPAWFHIEYSEDRRTLTYTIDENTTSEARDIEVNFWIQNTFSNRIYFTQKAKHFPIQVTPTLVEATAEGESGTINVTYDENITNDVAEVVFCNAEGEDATYDWITAEINATTKSLDYTIVANTGEARTAYLKVRAKDNDANDAYSELITITQAAYVAPPVVATITVSPTSVEAPCEGASGTISVTYNNITNVAADVYFCDSEGEAATYDWITAYINSENNVEYIIDANDGEARTAYMKVYALDDNAEKVYSEIITITQAAYVIDYATLPFEWEGGSSAGLLDIAGVTANGLGSDYGSNNSPYLVKFDGTGDYIQVKTDSQPGTVSIYVKMIGGNSSSSITVQGSADGETFTDVEELDISGNQNSTMELVTTKDFAATDRYVRLYFTKGSNVGVGAISITKYVEPVNPGTVPSITVDPYEVDVDANEHDGTLAISYENLTISGTDDFVIQYCDEDGNESEEPDWLEVLVAEQDPQIGEGYVVSYYMLENEGEARSAYFKVYALAGELVFSNLVTVTQAAPVITTTYTLATEIVPGKHYIITNGSNMAMGAQKENNRGAVGVSIVDGIATVSGESQPLEFVIYGPNVDGYYTIYDETAPGYLYAASSGSNYLKTQTTLDNNGKWSITFDDYDSEATIEAQGNNSRNLMRFNNSSNLFSCYGSGQQAIYLYVKSEEEAPTETVTITDAKYATFCSKNAFDFSQTGATVYKATVSTQNKVVAMIPVEDGIVPAYTGVILFKDDAGELIVPVSKTKGESVWSDNAMIGTTERTLVKKQNGSNFNYILQKDSESGKVVFNMAKEAGAYMPAGRAYLSTTVDASASNSRLSVMFADDVVTSIAGMNHETSGTANDVYDLQGRKVDTSLMKKGLYIVRSGKNARKVVK